MLPIVENIVRAQEKHVRNEWTEADDFIESNYNMYQDGYNWGNLEANYVKSLTGPGFYSPFWKAYKGSKGFDVVKNSNIIITIPCGNYTTMNESKISYHNDINQILQLLNL